MSKGFWLKGQSIWRNICVPQVAANAQVALPAYTEVIAFYFVNRTANAVTGGIRVGSAAAGTQYVTAQAVAGTIDLPVKVGSSINGIAATAGIMYIEAVTAWNSAIVDVVIETKFLPPYNMGSSAPAV